MNILIANLGNRNIRFKGKVIVDYLNENEIKSTFKAFTQDLLSNFEDEKMHIEVKIIPSAIEFALSKGLKINKVILFKTDQGDSPRSGTDTLFEAEIIAKLLQSPELAIQQEMLKCDPTDTQELHKRYQVKVSNILKTLPSDTVVLYCLQGGTAQQKTALNLVLEYLLSEEKYKPVEVRINENTDSSTVDWGKIEYIKETTARYQIRSLIETGAYQAAATLADNAKLNEIQPILNWVGFLFTNDERLKIKPSLTQAKLALFPFETEVNNKRWVLFQAPNPTLTNYLVKDKVWQLQLKLSVSQFYLQRGNHQAFFMEFFRFQEALLGHLLEKNLSIPYITDYYKVSKCLTQVASTSQSYIKFFPDYKPGDSVRDSIPTFLLLLSGIELGPFNEMISQFMQVNQLLRGRSTIKQKEANGGWDSLRNKHVHEGKPVLEPDIEEILPTYINFFDSLIPNFISEKENLFSNLNSIIVSHFI